MSQFSWIYFITVDTFNTHFLWHCPGYLPDWCQNEMGTVLKKTFSTAFSWKKIFAFSLEFDWNLFQKVQLTISEHWFRWWLGAKQAASHYLNQWWPSPYDAKWHHWTLVNWDSRLQYTLIVIELWFVTLVAPPVKSGILFIWIQVLYWSPEDGPINSWSQVNGYSVTGCPFFNQRPFPTNKAIPWWVCET